MLHLPSCSIRSSYLKKLPIGTIFTDPKNEYSYQIVEKRVGSSLVKTAINYLGNEQPIKLENVPSEMFKIENPTKANPSLLLKNKIASLEEKCRSLLINQHKSLYHRMKEILDDDCHVTADTYYILNSGLVLPFKRKYYSTLDDARENVEDMVQRIFQDSAVLPKVLEKQHKLQSKLLKMILSGEDAEDDVKEIIL